MWQLLNDYEEEMKLLQPVDALKAVETADFFREEATIAVVESRAAVHSFHGEIEIRARRHYRRT